MTNSQQTPFSMVKQKAFSLRSGTIQGCPLGSLLITMDLEVLAMAIREELKKKKRIQIGKEEVKLSLFADNKKLFIGNPEDATRKLLEVINEFGNMAIYKNEIFYIPIY